MLQTYISKAGNFPFGNKRNRQKSIIPSISMASSLEAQPFLCTTLNHDFTRPPMGKHRPHGHCQCCSLRPSASLHDMFPTAHLEHQDHSQVEVDRNPWPPSCLHSGHPGDSEHGRSSNRHENKEFTCSPTFPGRPWFPGSPCVTRREEGHGYSVLPVSPSVQCDSVSKKLHLAKLP